jgi:hypothetical protein
MNTSHLDVDYCSDSKVLNPFLCQILVNTLELKTFYTETQWSNLNWTDECQDVSTLIVTYNNQSIIFLSEK